MTLDKFIDQLKTLFNKEKSDSTILKFLKKNKQHLGKRDRYGETALTVILGLKRYELATQLVAKFEVSHEEANLEIRGKALLFRCASAGHLTLVNALLTAGADKDKETETHHNHTPLYTAALYGHIDIVRTLLGHGANINKETATSAYTPLLAASIEGDINLVKLLLDSGADFNKADFDDATPLYTAALKGHIEIVRLLIRRGANIDTTEGDGATPLYIAAEKGHVEIVEMLLTAGADKDKTTKDKTFWIHFGAGADKDNDEINRSTPLYIAVKKGHVTIVNALLLKGADKDKANGQGLTPLHAAAEIGNLDVVNALLKNGAAIDMAANNGNTPLHLAAENGHLDIVNTLLENGAALNINNARHETALCIAICREFNAIAKALLAKGAATETPRYNGRQPLFLAAKYGNLDMVSTLLAYRADVNAVSGGITSLVIAARRGHEGIVKRLAAHPQTTLEMLETYNRDRSICPYIRHYVVYSQIRLRKERARKEQLEKEANSLSVAVKNRDINKVKRLLATDSDPDEVNADGMTPLYIAAEGGNITIVTVLLAFEVNVNSTWNNSTPLLIAALASFSDIVKLLAGHPEITLETLQTYANDSRITPAIQHIFRDEIDMRLGMAGHDVTCKKALESWPKCPISIDYILTPVKTVDGHVYERSQIIKWFMRHDTSPLTNLKLPSKALEPSVEATAAINKARKTIDTFCQKKIAPHTKAVCQSIKERIIKEHEATKNKEDKASSTTQGRFFQVTQGNGGRKVINETTSSIRHKVI